MGHMGHRERNGNRNLIVYKSYKYAPIIHNRLILLPWSYFSCIMIFQSAFERLKEWCRTQNTNPGVASSIPRSIRLSDEPL